MSRVRIVLAILALFGADWGWGQSAARQAGYLYLSPVPQASYVSEQTRYILVRLVNVVPSQVTNLTNGFITVIGANSGPHSGSTRIAGDGRTVIFDIDTDFSTNELVTVKLVPVLGAGMTGGLDAFDYQFITTAPMPGSLPLSVRPPSQVSIPASAVDLKMQPRISATPGRRRAGRKAMVLSNGVSVPSDFPQVLITANTNPSPGYLFLENALDGVPPYTMMLDNSGLPVWYQRGRLLDLKIQKNGMITYGCLDDAGLATFYGCDQNFNLVRTYATSNGYLTDPYELKILPDGTYFLIGYRHNTVDMSQYITNGPIADVIETVIQEFTSADELIFQWRAWDNYDIRDLEPLGNTDFPHMNGVDIDEDGNLLVSARHLSEVTKLNLDSGDIIWRLSGAHSSFTFVNDPFNGTSYQHDISALGKGHYMVFDNGDSRSPPVSRAVEYQLDLTNRTATMVWQFRDN